MEYEERVRIATPEGVELELHLAGLGSRVIAGSIDLLVKVAVLLALFIALPSSQVGLAVWTTLSFVVYFGYDIAFEVLGGGRTLGKRATGLRVTADDGAPVGFRRSIVRNLVRLLDGPGTGYIVGMASILLTRRSQRLGDLAAGTYVLRERHAADRVARTEAPPPALEGAFDVSAVSMDELVAVRLFLERRPGLEAAPRATLAAQLAQGLRDKVTGAPEDGSDEDFLEWVAAAKASRR